MTSHVSKWRKSACLTWEPNCKRLGSEKKSMPKWHQFSSFNLYSPPPLFLTHLRLQECSLAALSPDEVLRVHSPGHAWHAGPSDGAWHGTRTVYSSRLLLVGNRSELPQCIFIIHHHHRQATEFLTLDFHPKLTPVSVVFRQCTSE